jgi:hypothetical protein
MFRLAPVVSSLAVVAACSSTGRGDAERHYAGKVQKVTQVERQAEGVSLLNRIEIIGSLVNSAIRRRPETNQYVIRTSRGQISAQSDQQFSVGQCVEVIPEGERASGPAFTYGEARIVEYDGCG